MSRRSHISIGVLILAFFSMSLTATAQEGVLQYINHNAPQAANANPAFAPEADLTIGIPGISSLIIGHRDELFHPSLMFDRTTEGLNFNSDRYLDNLADHDQMSTDVSVELLSVGKRFGDDFFRFSVRQRATVSIDMPKDLLRFPLIGNGNFEETDGLLDFSGLAVDMMSWKEVGIGWQRPLSERTRVGLTARMLFGQQSVETERSDIRWRTDPTTYGYEIQGGLDFNTSGWTSDLYPESGQGRSIEESYLGLHNLGASIDLGVDHDISDRLSISAAVTDLGFIRWSGDVTQHRATGQDIVFNGIRLTETFIAADSAFSDSLDAAVTDLIDGVERDLGIDGVIGGEYTTALSSIARVGVEYAVVEGDKSRGTAGLLFSSRSWNQVWTPEVTAYYRHELGDRLNARLAYSQQRFSGGHLSAGLTARAGPVQLDLGLENVNALSLARLTAEVDGDAVLYPAEAGQYRLYVGIQLLFGRKAASTVVDPE